MSTLPAGCISVSVSSLFWASSSWKWVVWVAAGLRPDDRVDERDGYGARGRRRGARATGREDRRGDEQAEQRRAAGGSGEWANRSVIRVRTLPCPPMPATDHPAAGRRGDACRSTVRTISAGRSGRWPTAGATRRSGSRPIGSSGRRERPTGRPARSWRSAGAPSASGPGAPAPAWAVDHAPALLGLDDDPAAFRPDHPLLDELARRYAGNPVRSHGGRPRGARAGGPRAEDHRRRGAPGLPGPDSGPWRGCPGTAPPAPGAVGRAPRVAPLLRVPPARARTSPGRPAPAPGAARRAARGAQRARSGRGRRSGSRRSRESGRGRRARSAGSRSAIPTPSASATTTCRTWSAGSWPASGPAATRGCSSCSSRGAASAAGWSAGWSSGRAT